MGVFHLSSSRRWERAAVWLKSKLAGTP